MPAMKLKSTITAAILILSFLGCASGGKKLDLAQQKQDEQDLFLEDVYGKEALAWVEERNQKTYARLQTDPHYKKIESEALKILDAKDRLLGIQVRKGYVYNIWKDEKNQRGLYRRATLKSYLNKTPKWETLLDLDKLAKEENESWVFAGMDYFENRVLMNLSKAGKDAKVTREFDLETRQFVKGGFELPEGKNSITWIDRDTVFLGLASDGDVTESGYPRTLRIWRRGENYKNLVPVFSGKKTDVSVWPVVFRDEIDTPANVLMVSQNLDFFNRKYFVLIDSVPRELRLPTDVELSSRYGKVYVENKSNWKLNGETISPGSLVAFDLQQLITGKAQSDLIFKPSEAQILSQFYVMKDRLYLGLIEHVKHKWVKARLDSQNKWTQNPLALPENSTLYPSALSEIDDVMMFDATGFLLPTTRYQLTLSNSKVRKLEASPARFKKVGLTVSQFFAKSKDGTQIPYYVVHKKDLLMNGQNPTILDAYGGFEISKMPYYSGVMGKSWLERGGVYVSANIRGGGEYGPQWHQAALKENRQRAFDDFFAVAEDLIARKITSSKKLGIVGGSNGGLLMGAAITQRPELFQAAAIQVPLLDMLRYHKLLAGASWVGEYGSPDDPKMRPILASYSPYHNLRAGVQYPEVIFMTSTADDRVHPGHARKMAAKMERMGYKFLYYENTEGGHGGSANNKQYAKWAGLQYTYFVQKLMNDKD